MSKSEIVARLEMIEAACKEIREIIGACPSSIKSSRSIDKDQDLDLDLNQDQSDHDLDQDQDSRIRETVTVNYEEWFRTYCSSIGVDASVYRLDGMERNIQWLRTNRDKVNSPRRYVEKMLAKAPIRTVGFRQSEEPEPERELTEIYGIPIEEIDQRASELSREQYVRIRASLGLASSLFPPYADLLGNSAKLRVFVAKGIASGSIY